MPGERRASPVVVNADDFGLSSEVNAGIAEAFERDLVSSTSLLANLPAFEPAVVMARGRAWAGRIGVHLNLSEGPPLTKPIRGFPQLCGADGRLCMEPSTRFRLTRGEALAIEQELEAQVRACLDRGIRPTHFDSHGHTHTQWPVATIVIALARRYSVPAIRLSRNCGPSPGVAKAVYKGLFNARLRRAGLAKVRYFGSAGDCAEVVARGLGPVEVMVHPVRRADGMLVDALPPHAPLDGMISKLGAGPRLSGYADLGRLAS